MPAAPAARPDAAPIPCASSAALPAKIRAARARRIEGLTRGVSSSRDLSATGRPQPEVASETPRATRGRHAFWRRAERLAGFPGTGAAFPPRASPAAAARRGPGGVREHLVDLPRRSVGVRDPDLVLHGVAAGHSVLGAGGEARALKASR